MAKTPTIQMYIKPKNNEPLNNMMMLHLPSKYVHSQLTWRGEVNCAYSIHEKHKRCRLTLSTAWSQLIGIPGLFALPLKASEKTAGSMRWIASTRELSARSIVRCSFCETCAERSGTSASRWSRHPTLLHQAAQRAGGSPSVQPHQRDQRSANWSV